MAAKTSDPIDILLEMGIDLDNLSEEEDYLSALKEAIAKIQFQTKGAGDERSAILSQEVIKVRKSRKAADPKFKAKKTTVKPDAFFERKKPEEQAQPVPGQRALPGKQSTAIVKRKTIKSEKFKKLEEPEQDEKKKRKTKKSDPLKDILKSVNSILATLKNSNKITKKQAERDRKDAEKAKRGAQEDKLEASPMKKFFAGAKKLAKPAINFFESIMQFIMKVLIGRLLVKILSWMGDPENSKKMTAIMDFFKVTWPAFLAAFLAFQFGLGGFITGLLGLIGGFIPKLLGLIPKMLAGLGKLATGNPVLVAAAAGAALFALGKIVPEVAPQTVETDTDKKVDESIKKKGGEQTATDLGEEQATKEGERNAFQKFFFGKVMGEDAEYEKQLKRARTGKEPEFGKKFNKGGIVPGSGPNKDTVPAMLTPGEFVMSRGAVQTYGSDTLESMNAMGGGTNVPSFSFNAGGIVPGYNGGGHVDPESGLPMKSAQNKETGKADADKDALTETIVVPKDGMSFDPSVVSAMLSSRYGVDAKPVKTASMVQPTQTMIPSSDKSTTAKNPIVASMGFSQGDFDVFRTVVASIESGGKYDIAGGSGGHYDGRYQLGAAAKTDGARYAGVKDPGHTPEAREEFRKNPQLQEALFAGFTKANHTYLMRNSEYKNANPRRKLQILGYAHNQGMGGAEKWMTTGVVGSDGFGTKGTKYTDEIAKAFRTGNVPSISAPSNTGTLLASDSSSSLSSDGGGGDTQPSSAQMKPAGTSKPLPPPSRGQKLSDLYAQQEARAGRGSSSGSSASAEGANSGALNTPNSNDLPPIDANAMISMEKIKVLGLTVV